MKKLKDRLQRIESELTQPYEFDFVVVQDGEEPPPQKPNTHRVVIRVVPPKGEIRVTRGK